MGPVESRACEQCAFLGVFNQRGLAVLWTLEVEAPPLLRTLRISKTKKNGRGKKEKKTHVQIRLTYNHLLARCVTSLFSLAPVSVVFVRVVDAYQSQGCLTCEGSGRSSFECSPPRRPGGPHVLYAFPFPRAFRLTASCYLHVYRVGLLLGCESLR